MVDKMEFLLYVDEPYVESIYNLTYPHIVEQKESSNKIRRNKANLEAKISKLLPITFGSGNEIGIEKVNIIESTILPSIENKINKLIEQKFNNQSIVAIDLVEKHLDSGLYFLEGVFKLLAIETKRGEDVVSNQKYRNSPKGLLWRLQLETYNLVTAKVNLILSGDKILMNLHHLTEEIEKYKEFHFYILGKVTKHDVENYSIKPIAIFY